MVCVAKSSHSAEQAKTMKKSHATNTRNRDNACSKPDIEQSEADPLSIHEVAIGCIASAGMFVLGIIHLFTGSVSSRLIHLDGLPARLWGVCEMALPFLIIIFLLIYKNRAGGGKGCCRPDGDPKKAENSEGG